MTLEQFRYVLEISQTGSFNQAAANLFLSQSTLSLSIKNLEREIGHNIFLRTSKGISITPFGNVFISYISTIILQTDELKKKICHEFDGGKEQSLSVCSQGFAFISGLCRNLYDAYGGTGLMLEIYDAPGDDTINMVRAGQIDLGVIRIWNCYRDLFQRQFAMKEVVFTHLYMVPIAIMIGAGNPLYGKGLKTIKPQMLQSFPLVMDTYSESGPYSDIIKKLNLSYSITRFRTNSRAALYEILQQTPAFYISSNINLPGKYFNKNTESILLEDCDVRSEIGWIRRKDHTLSSCAEYFINLLTNYFASYPKQ